MVANGRGGGGKERRREVFWFLKKWNHYNSRRTANCRGWGGRIGGGRCPGIIKSGTTIIQGGKLTAGGGGKIGGGRCPGIIKSGTTIIQGGQLNAG